MAVTDNVRKERLVEVAKITRVSLSDGRNIEAYEGWEKWDYRRWAWEYLRRNPAFREACSAASMIKVKSERVTRKREIAAEFMLRRYRHCDFPYEEGKRPPTFAATRASPKSESSEVQEWSVQLRPDQVALVFHLGISLHSKTAVKALLSSARKQLERRVQYLRDRTEHHKLHPQPHLNREQHLHNLRLLDAFRSGGKPIDIARAKWYESYAKGVPAPRVAERIRKAHESAKALTEFGYIALLTATDREGKLPIGPKVPTPKRVS
ncbi:hypothetical protein N0A02_00645 [Paraburkholderia acidicola]|uniref:Transcriptional regulator-like domain-containing protein n=1 Tax=Paraburkholderia acidicola TaxID=1912599 RepID=A0ABV1LFB5_9BURK